MAFDGRSGVYEDAMQRLAQGDPTAASAATSAMLHCTTPHQHRGRVSFDYTSPGLRLVDPEHRKYQFPNFDFLSPDTEAEDKEPEEDETDRDPDQPSEPRSPRAEEEHAQPLGGWGDGQYQAGRCISIERRTISCRARKQGVAMLLQDEFVGGSIVLKGDQRGLIQTFAEGNNIDQVWRIAPMVKPMAVVTGVELTNDGLKFRRAAVLAWKDRNLEDVTIPFEKHSNLVTAELDANGLKFTSEDVYYIGAKPRPSEPPEFNIPIADCTATTP